MVRQLRPCGSAGGRDRDPGRIPLFACVVLRREGAWGQAIEYRSGVRVELDYRGRRAMRAALTTNTPSVPTGYAVHFLSEMSIVQT